MGVAPSSGCGSLEGGEEALARLAKEQTSIQTVWTARRIKLDLLLQLRLFQRDAMQVKLGRGGVGWGGVGGVGLGSNVTQCR